MMMDASNKAYKLDKLTSYIGEDPVVVRDMVQIFIQSGASLLNEINTGVELKDYEMVTKAAHALKTSLDIFGIDDQYHPIREIELLSKNKAEHETLLKLSKQLNLRLRLALDQLAEDFG